MISHVSVCLLAHEKMLDFKHFLSRKTGVQLFGSSDWLYSRFFISACNIATASCIEMRCVA